MDVIDNAAFFPVCTYVISYDNLLEFHYFVHFHLEQMSQIECFWFAKTLFNTIFAMN